MTERVQLLRLDGIDCPSRLLRLYKRPQCLYIKGNSALLHQPTLAIIGTRQGSEWGLDQAFKSGKMVSKENITVISGLARGVDTAAHRGALEGSGSTIAVLGSGFDHIYPFENLALSEQIGDKGALVSEYEPSVRPARHHFLRRNRLIAGFSDMVLVIDAHVNSGTLNAASFAHRCGIPTYALSNPSAGNGNKQLIEKGIAKPLADSEQILEMMLHPHLRQQQLTFGFSMQNTGVHSG